MRRKQFNILLFFLLVLQSGWATALPESYWNKSNSKYEDYPLHTSPTFTGVADGAIEEITGIAQLVKLGVEVVQSCYRLTGNLNSVQNEAIHHESRELCLA